MSPMILGNAVSDSHAGQTAAIIKRFITNARNAIGDGHAGQTGATYTGTEKLHDTSPF